MSYFTIVFKYSCCEYVCLFVCLQQNLGSTTSASRNQMTSDPMLRENEKEEEIQSETDDFLANLDEEFSKITSGQMVENSGKLDR